MICHKMIYNMIIKQITINDNNIIHNFSIKPKLKNIFVGPNGSYKSTIINTIFNILTDNYLNIKDYFGENCEISIDLDIQKEFRDILIKVIIMEYIIRNCRDDIQLNNHFKLIDYVFNKLQSNENFLQQLTLTFFSNDHIQLNTYYNFNLDNYNEFLSNIFNIKINTDGYFTNNTKTRYNIENHPFYKSILSNMYYSVCNNVVKSLELHSMIMTPKNFIQNFLKQKVILIDGSLGNNIKLREIRNNLWILKINNYTKFKLIRNDFLNVIGKTIDVNYIKCHNNLDDSMNILLNGKNGMSTGEIDLLYFLINYYNDDGILLIDEPCVYLSPENKKKFVHYIFERDNYNCQIFTITHDPFLISINNAQWMTRFYINNNKLVYKSIDLQNNELKLIFEHKECFFSDKCILVEGYYDALVINQFLNIINFFKYNVIYTGGCSSILWKLLDHFNIEYKIIYDYDVLETYEIKHMLNILINNVIVNNNITNDIKLFEFFRQSPLNNLYSSKINKNIDELYIKSKSKHCNLNINIEKYKKMLVDKYMINFLNIDDNTNLNFYNKI
jgi:energy-coupling factor transporter ATP-binding protein EcfA2